MAELNPQSNSPKLNVSGRVSISGVTFDDITLKEIVMAESLLTPGVQTALTLQSFIHSKNPKNFDTYKNKDMTLSLKNDRWSAVYSQKIYRLDNRSVVPNNLSPIEEFQVHGCDQSLLSDAKTLVSKSWKCDSPKDVVSYALGCAGVQYISFPSGNIQPNRGYIAENIHPFQVVAQQANVAHWGGDPSFVHYVTYNTAGGPGIHHFKSLNYLTQQPAKKTFRQYEAGVTTRENYAENFDRAIAFSFPCDFDLLSDLLNGLNEGGAVQNTLGVFNPFSGLMEQLGNAAGGCGIGGFNYKLSMTNQKSADQQNACPTDVETHLLKRQARMALLEKDKVALRLVGAWDPSLHAGDVIHFDWYNKYANVKNYGTGDYLISSLAHNIQMGGFSTTTLDCVSVTAGGGIV